MPCCLRVHGEKSHEVLGVLDVLARCCVLSREYPEAIAHKERAQRIRELELASRKAQQTQLVIETPYRNPALWQALLAQLQPQTWLSVSCGLTLDKGFSHTDTVAHWRSRALDLPTDVPAVFSWLAT